MLETALRLLLALYLISGGALVAYALAGRLLPRSTMHVRFCGTLLCGMGLSTLGFHLMVPLRLFRLPVVTAALSLLLCITLANANQRAQLVRLYTRDKRWLRRVGNLWRESSQARWAVAFAVCALPVLLRPLALPPIGWDLLSYHGPKAALWVQNGGPALALTDGSGTWAHHRNFFAGAEVLYAFALLPLREELLPMVMQSLQWLCLGGAALAVGRELGAREPYGSTAAGFLLAIPTTRLLVGSGYVDIPVALCAAAGVALVARLYKRRDEDALGLALLGGAGLGLACGIKLFAIPTAAIALSLLLLRTVLQRRKRAAFLAIAACVFFASPWPLYNLLDKGRPLWPLHMTVAGLELGGPESTRIKPEPPLPPAYNLAVERIAASKTFPLGAVQSEALGAPTLLPLAVLLGSAPLWLRRRRWQALFGLLVALGSMAIFYMPIMNGMRLAAPSGISRYWLIALAVAIPASVWWCDKGAGRIYLAALRMGLFYQLLRLTTFGHTPFDMDLMALSLCAIIALYLLLRELRSTRIALAVGILGVTMIGTYLTSWRDAQRYYTMRHDYVLDGTVRYFVPAAELLDVVNRPLRIAVTAGYQGHADHWLSYPFFGRRLQNAIFYIPTTEMAFIDSDNTMPSEAWLKRLDEQRATHVISFPPASDELRWMERAPQRFRRVYGQPGQWGVFEIRRETH